MSLFKYRYWCTSENKYVESWADTPPTKCPNSLLHEIDLNNLVTVESILDIPPTSQDGKPRVQTTPRPIGTCTHFTSYGDDVSSPDKVGGGQQVHIHHSIGGDINQHIYVDYNTIENLTYVYSGKIEYQNAYCDRIILDVVPRLMEITMGQSGTLYGLAPSKGGYIILPSMIPGITGNIGIPAITNNSIVANAGLIYAPPDDQGNQSTAFWNADYNKTTNNFENISPAPYGNGKYNMFWAPPNTDIVLLRFFDSLFLGSGTRNFGSNDVDEFGHGCRLKVTAITNTTEIPDHTWAFIGEFNLFRDKTI